MASTQQKVTVFNATRIDDRFTAGYMKISLEGTPYRVFMPVILETSIIDFTKEAPWGDDSCTGCHEHEERGTLH